MYLVFRKIVLCTLGCLRYVSTHSMFNLITSILDLYPLIVNLMMVCKGTLMYGNSSAKIYYAK